MSIHLKHKTALIYIHWKLSVAWRNPPRELSGISRLSVRSHFSISPLFFFCLVLSLFLSYPFLIYFSLNLHFPKGRLLWVALCFFERLGDEYVSWWSMQHMVPYGTGMSLYAVITYFSFAIVLFYKKKPTTTGIELPDRNGQCTSYS